MTKPAARRGIWAKFQDKKLERPTAEKRKGPPAGGPIKTGLSKLPAPRPSGSRTAPPALVRAEEEAAVVVVEPPVGPEFGPVLPQVGSVAPPERRAAR